jgi:hypothetical protein
VVRETEFSLYGASVVNKSANLSIEFEFGLDVLQFQRRTKSSICSESQRSGSRVNWLPNDVYSHRIAAKIDWGAPERVSENLDAEPGTRFPRVIKRASDRDLRRAIAGVFNAHGYFGA